MRHFTNIIAEIFSYVMAKVLNLGLEVREFKHMKHYNFYFQTNAVGKGMNPFNPEVWKK